MKRFLIRFSSFLVPIVVLFIIPTYFLINSGENFRSVSDITRNRSKQFLVGYKFNESNYRYIKWNSINNSETLDVLALGSSRVLQFRDSMFTGKFYNSGFTIQSINDFEPFLKGLKVRQLPQIIIISLDQWMFNSAWDDLEISRPPDYWSKSFDYFPAVSTLKNVWIGLIIGSVPIYRPVNTDIIKIGLGAQIDESGIRNDGSYSYGKLKDNILMNDTLSSDFFMATYERIVEGNSRFEFGQNVNRNAMLKLEEFLIFCKSKNVFVVGFLPPFANTVAQKMNESGKYGYIRKLSPTLDRLMKRYKFEFYNFGSLDSCGSSDLEAIDGFHGSEVTYSRLLLKMLERNSKLNMFCDSVALKFSLSKSRSRLEVY